MVEKDYLDINAVTPIQVFNRALAKKVLEYTKKHIPFDEPCARLEFRDKLERAEKESERRFGFVKHDEIKIDIGDLDKYADKSRFEFIDKQEQYVDKVMEGMRTQVIVGNMEKYRCKARGHNIAVFVPNKKKIEQVSGEVKEE